MRRHHTRSPVRVNRFSAAVGADGSQNRDGAARPLWPARTHAAYAMPRACCACRACVMLAAECEPWAKTGGLADVVDALARALGQLATATIETPVDVFLPRYRGVPEPAGGRADHDRPGPGSATRRRAAAR